MAFLSQYVYLYFILANNSLLCSCLLTYWLCWHLAVEICNAKLPQCSNWLDLLPFLSQYFFIIFWLGCRLNCSTTSLQIMDPMLWMWIVCTKKRVIVDVDSSPSSPILQKLLKLTYVTNFISIYSAETVKRLNLLRYNAVDIGSQVGELHQPNCK